MGPCVRRDDETRAFTFSRRHFARGFQFRLRLFREEGAGKDRVRAAPAVSCALCIKKKGAHEHTGSAETLRPSLRNGFPAYAALSLVTGFIVTIVRERLWGL